MKEAERLQEIVRVVAERGFASARDLCDLTGASAATLRRDLAKLDADGLLRRVHGGAQATGALSAPELATASFDASRSRFAPQKRAIAKAAAALCEDGDSIIVNAGTTTFPMVDFLRDKQLQVITNSFPMAQALVANSRNRVVLPGGEIRREQGIVLSPFDDDGLHRIAASMMFMSCYSVGPLGVIEGDPLIARAEAKLLDRADALILMVDSSKFASRGSLAVCPLSRVSILITDEGAPPEALEMARSRGIETIVVPTDTEQAGGHLSVA